MSIAHLKKQAKNLVRLLPAHISANPAGGSLAACQELIARASGYPSFHAAVSTEPSERVGPLLLSPRILDDLQDAHRQAAARNDCAWAWRAEQLISAVLELQLRLEFRGETLEADRLYALDALEQANAKWRGAFARRPSALDEYLACLPLYERPEKRGLRPVSDPASQHHHQVAMPIKSVREQR